MVKTRWKPVGNLWILGGWGSQGSPGGIFGSYKISGSAYTTVFLLSPDVLKVHLGYPEPAPDNIRVAPGNLKAAPGNLKVHLGNLVT